MAVFIAPTTITSRNNYTRGGLYVVEVNAATTPRTYTIIAVSEPNGRSYRNVGRVFSSDSDLDDFMDRADDYKFQFVLKGAGN